MDRYSAEHAMWNLSAPPGFQGLREDLPLRVYYRHLPHWRQEGATYFVTFRLDDSLPQAKLQELAAWRTEWERRHPLFDDEYPLENIVQSWKQFSAKRINQRRHASGSVWQEESFDRIVRDEEHLFRCIQYIGANPSKAGSAVDACPRWIRSQWKACGWKFEGTM